MNKMDTGDVALTSRVRLARNHADLPFPGFQDLTQAQESIRRAVRALSDDKHNLRPIELDKMSDLDRQSLVERRVISRDLLRAPERCAVLRSDDEMISVMINEEDHLRIQAFSNKFDLTHAAERAFEVDDWLSESLSFAFDPELGYLTACPTNTGTGMRASVMLHLPALTWSGEMNKVTAALSKLGMTLRGLYGEGSEAQGDLYQLSNQWTLGRSEEEILDEMIAASSQMVAMERKVRLGLQLSDKITLEDRLYRAIGILERCRKISAKEFMQMWSGLRLASCMDIYPLPLTEIDKILTAAQPACLQQSVGETLDESRRDELRARLIQKMMKPE
ncbi:protein-arginine kinase [Clostridia bacterium]|nr:protein-arginine kinase [Clostridia bacterium]